MDCPNRRTISGLALEHKILEELNRIVSEYCQTEEIRIFDGQNEHLQQLEQQLTALEVQQNTAKQRLFSMYKDKLDGVISDGDFALFREQLNAEETALSAQITDVRAKLSDCRNLLECAQSRKKIIAKYSHFDVFDRSIAEEFIELVEVGMAGEHGEREIHIVWKL